MDKPMHRWTLTKPPGKTHHWWLSFPFTLILLVAIWFPMAHMEPPANFIVAFLFAIGFWVAGSIPKLSAQSQSVAFELKSAAACFVGIAGAIVITEVFF